jgi:hypothetical protein
LKKRTLNRKQSNKAIFQAAHILLDAVNADRKRAKLAPIELRSGGGKFELIVCPPGKPFPVRVMRVRDLGMMVIALGAGSNDKRLHEAARYAAALTTYEVTGSDGDPLIADMTVAQHLERIRDTVDAIVRTPPGRSSRVLVDACELMTPEEEAQAKAAWEARNAAKAARLAQGLDPEHWGETE